MLILEQIIGLMAPHQCLLCGTEGSLLCAWCFPEAVPKVPSRCYKCYKSTLENAVCQKCRRVSKLGHVWVSTEYGGVSKQLIHMLKFQRARAAAAPIATLMVNTLPYLSEQVVIVHIPAATSRVRARGYDQAKLLAQHISRFIKRRHVAALTRHGQSRQVGSRRVDRFRQMEGVFRCPKPYMVTGAHILLVDDVLTTGATLEEAAKVLKAAGAKTVDAVVFAQKF